MPLPQTNSEDPLPRLSPRARDGHKGDHGRLLIIGGSRGMSGAVALTGMAALRSGAGLVTLAVPEVCLETIATFEPSYMTVPLPCDKQGRITLAAQQVIEELSGPATVIACGPGLGQSEPLIDFIDWINAFARHPVVFDADALNGLAHIHTVLPDAAGPRILTPHPGEFRRLVHQPDASSDEMRQIAIEFARENKVIMLLKGHRSVITDGCSTFENETGNPGMATGGSGDVLTGVITALIGQGLAPLEAARLGTHVHGRAGDLAANELGEVSMIARDLIEFLPAAFLSLDTA